MQQEDVRKKCILPKNIQKKGGNPTAVGQTMRTIPRTIEMIAVTVLTSVISITALIFFKNLLLLLLIAPVIQTALVLLYRFAVRPHIENALSGTVCEPTQMHCYIREDESEETGV